MDMSKKSILALIGAAALSLSTVVVATSQDAVAAERTQTAHPAKSSTLNRDARQSFNQLRTEGRAMQIQRPVATEPDRLRPPAQPGAM
jgi:hypothetical protein